MFNIEIERLKRLPVRRGEVWQGDLVPLDLDVGDPEAGGSGGFRPVMATCVSQQSLAISPVGEMVRPAEATPLLVWKALLGMAEDPEVGGYRPERVVVRSEALEAFLRAPLAEAGIELGRVKRLKELDRVVGEMVEELASAMEDDGIPPALGPDVSAEAFAGFLQAAVAFQAAAPWRLFEATDMVAVESPTPPPGMAIAMVGGKRRSEAGVMLFENAEAFWAMQAHDVEAEPWEAVGSKGVWTLMLVDPEETPRAARQAMERLGGELSSLRYPILLRVNPMAEEEAGILEPPSAAELAFVEGLLLALAEAQSPDLDSGRWSVTVATSAGEARYTLALPDVLDPPSRKTLAERGLAIDRRVTEGALRRAERLVEEAGEGLTLEQQNELLNRNIGLLSDVAAFEPRDDRERAVSLCDRAFLGVGRRRELLAREALSLWPDCADAHVLLAEAADDVETALAHFERGVEAGRRALGAERFEERDEDGSPGFWGDLETRPYMRARLGLAYCLLGLDREQEAADHFRALLELNPNDNQGARYELLPLLLELGRDDEAEALWKRYEEDGSAIWAYGRALLAFRQEGDTPAARRALASARRVNPHVVKLLLGKASPPPDSPPYYRRGSEDEAVYVSDSLEMAWDATPGAIDWLGRQPRTARRSQAGAGRKQRKQRKPRKRRR